MDDFKHSNNPGGGGYKCPCCGPKPGAEKKSWRRLARRRLKQKDRNDEAETKEAQSRCGGTRYPEVSGSCYQIEDNL